ncbi:hypothetical protein CVT24_004897 [Panaeolus cyanescens]|uniref:Uncharacterized protein n=1 Tax=Panaeolus cyanescens TaxID=181874 RepID=A0A409XBV6_9AGAR|nr:hypothetical protein CVT24_004897 [Panaeolus cyanescens]
MQTQEQQNAGMEVSRMLADNAVGFEETREGEDLNMSGVKPGTQSGQGSNQTAAFGTSVYRPDLFSRGFDAILQDGDNDSTKMQRQKSDALAMALPTTQQSKSDDDAPTMAPRDAGVKPTPKYRGRTKRKSPADNNSEGGQILAFPKTFTP